MQKSLKIVIFDVVHRQKRNVPYCERQKELERLVEHEFVYYSPDRHTIVRLRPVELYSENETAVDRFKRLFCEFVSKYQFEGLVAKRADSLYTQEELNNIRHTFFEMKPYEFQCKSPLDMNTQGNIDKDNPHWYRLKTSHLQGCSIWGVVMHKILCPNMQSDRACYVIGVACDTRVEPRSVIGTLDNGDHINELPEGSREQIEQACKTAPHTEKTLELTKTRDFYRKLFGDYKDFKDKMNLDMQIQFKVTEFEGPYVQVEIRGQEILQRNDKVGCIVRFPVFHCFNASRPKWTPSSGAAGE